jgi:hypothetical protein
MWAAIIRWVTGDLVGQLAGAYKAAQNAKTESERIAAGVQIKKIEATMAARADGASIIKTGMQHKAFWIPWLLAAVPLSAWFAWGVADSMLNGGLPDVATLPPQLKEYADVVWGNIFYVGGGVAGAQIVAGVLRR